VSHEVKQTLEIADHVVILDNGKVAFQGAVEEVRESTDPLVLQYVNALPDGPVRFHYPAVTIDEDFGFPIHSTPAPGGSQ
jgi:phospholipid/cholesterol/gamma-HCH transport system ATP-binding protein